MSDDIEAKFCRREIGQETPAKFCARAIKHVNPLEWCDECRAARLPFWPKDDEPGSIEAAHTEALTLNVREFKAYVIPLEHLETSPA